MRISKDSNGRIRVDGQQDPILVFRPESEHGLILDLGDNNVYENLTVYRINKSPRGYLVKFALWLYLLGKPIQTYP